MVSKLLTILGEKVLTHYIKFLHMHGGITISKCHMCVYIYIYIHTHTELDSKHDLQVNNL